MCALSFEVVCSLSLSQKATFAARKDELESLRDRIKAMADEQDVRDSNVA